MKKLTKIATLTLIVLMISSGSLIFANSNSTVAKAQTTTAINAPTATPADMLNYTWNDVRATPEGTFASAGPGPTTPSITWKTDIPYAGGSMAAADGLVFVPSTLTGMVYALNAATGQIVWVKTFSGPPSLLGNAPTILDNTYMLLGGVCVFIANGTTVWTGPPGFSVGSNVDGIGYVPSIGMFLTGGCGWSLPNPAKPPTLAWNVTGSMDNAGGMAAIGGGAYGGGMVFVGGGPQGDGFLRAYDATTGSLIWTASVTTSMLYGMTYDNGLIIDGGLDNNMRAWNATTGKLLWTYNPHTLDGEWASSSAAAYGIVYEHNQDTYLYAINETTGQLIWRQEGPGIGYSDELSIAGGYVYCQMGENEYRNPNTGQYGTSEFDCYNAYTGQLVWTMPMEDGSPFNSQCQAYGNLYVCPSMGVGVPGVWSYTEFGFGSIGEVWCISSTPADWPMFGADPTHSSFGDGPAGNLTQKWSFNTGAEVVSPVTVANGVAYFGSTNDNIYAVNATTSAELWNFKTGYEVRSEVAVVNGYVYTGADDGNIYCLNAATGTKVWETPAGGTTLSNVGAGIFPPARSSPEVVNGKVYVGSLDGNLYCLDASSGTVLWKFQTGGPVEATPAVDSTGVYIDGSNPGNYGMNFNFYKLDPSTGSVIWNDSFPYNWQLSAASYITYGGVDASPTLAPTLGMVFLRTQYVNNWAINSTDGAVIWEFNSTTNAVGTSFQAGGVPQVCAPVYAYGLVYFNNYYDITAVNALTGKAVWSTYLSREDVSQALTYSYGRIYSVTELGVLYVLNALTGAKVSYYWFGCDLHSSPTLYNGSLYMGTNEWNVVCMGDSAIINAQSAIPVIPTPIPTATPTPSPSPTPVPTPTPLPVSSLLMPIYIAASVVLIAVVVAVVIVGILVLRTLKKRTG
jgi:outer membrane protein assembly factor BamB